MDDVGGRWSRRELLQRAVLLSAQVPVLGAVLAACSADRPAEVNTPASVLLPLHDDLRIDPDAPIERGAVLRVYEWRDYLDHAVVQGFVRRYADHDVDVRIESFTSMPEAAARLVRPDADFDVFFPVIDALPSLVQARLLRPLTHEALPHLRNLWPFFRDPQGPFYDVGQRYSVPYTVYSTGISWRRDLLGPSGPPDRLADPYDAYWDAGHEGEIGLVDDYREVIAMALLRRGLDPNDAMSADVDAAIEDAERFAQLSGIVAGQGPLLASRPPGEGRVVAERWDTPWVKVRPNRCS